MKKEFLDYNKLAKELTNNFQFMKQIRFSLTSELENELRASIIEQLPRALDLFFAEEVNE